MSGYVTADDATFVFGAYATHVDRSQEPESVEPTPRQLVESELNQAGVPDLAPPVEAAADPSPER